MERTEQELVRIEKAKNIRELGLDPFGQRFDRTHTSKQIKDEYTGKENEELEALNVEVKVAGRIMTKRGKGKAGFMHIQDRDGQIQIYMKSLHHLQFLLESLLYYQMFHLYVLL